MFRKIYLPGISFIISMLLCLTACRLNEAESVHNNDFQTVSEHKENVVISSDDIQGKVLQKNDNVPTYVIEILTYIRTYNKAPSNYFGGRRFYNREKRLPVKDELNKLIYYQEWDVHEKKAGINRGPERLVTSANKAYYTGDHYKTFILIKENLLKPK